MKIRHGLTERVGPPVVVAIGFFDGYHLGHREIVRTLLRLRKPGYRAAVLTFRNHPTAFLRPGDEPALIATTEERINALAEAGIEELYLLPFDASLASLTPQAFIADVLHATLHARAIVVGENFRYGKGRAGGIDDAAAQLSALGVTFVAVPNLKHDGTRVSSTRVREALLQGQVELVNALLGASYSIEGRVVLGAGRGHDLGFPTANLAVSPEKLLPKDGVYSVVARHDGRDYRGLVSIGTNPTFDGARRTVEVWIHDFNRSIYGDALVIRDMCFVREQRRFASADELREQMVADAAAVAFPTLSP
ncbi:MAG TPA: riboflavin biosynthesis protein RibF [Candidatus Binatia bacterium]|nr:riboflavin biosynthesis protein RibF [Candidatus Binatia bacterium]